MVFLPSGPNPMLLKKLGRLYDDVIPYELLFQGYLKKSLAKLCDDLIPDGFLQSGPNPILLVYY